MSKESVGSIVVLKLPEVLRRTGLSRSRLYELSAAGSFPSQIKLGGPRASGWIESEVHSWILKRIDASRSKTCIQGQVVNE
jgi:prophage regulatory protein